MKLKKALIAALSATVVMAAALGMAACDGGAAAQVSLRCPHCGAPVSKIGEKICPYCGSGVVSPLSQTWRITNIQPCN